MGNICYHITNAKIAIVDQVNHVAGTGKGEKKELDLYYLNDDPKEINRQTLYGGFGFAKTLFQKNEWDALKKLCLKKNIEQFHLNHIFNKYLDPETHADIFIRQFRVNTSDTKNTFLKKDRLLQELADLFLPLIYMKDYPQLLKPHSDNEISFARFVIMSYIFCAQCHADLIYDSLTMMRQRLDLKLHTVIFTFNFLEIVKVLNENSKKSAALKYVLRACNVANDEEISARKIIRMGIKYPILFYSLERFRTHYKRLVFGEKFWNSESQRKRLLKCRVDLEIVPDQIDIDQNINVNNIDHNQIADFFDNEYAAIKQTARAIISDYNYGADLVKIVKLNDHYYDIPDIISTETSIRLKHTLGYSFARDIIGESEMAIAESEKFVELDVMNGNDDIRFHDPKIECDFFYNPVTGKRAWIRGYFDAVTGDLLIEKAFRDKPDLHEQREADQRKKSKELLRKLSKESLNITGEQLNGKLSVNSIDKNRISVDSV